VLKLLTVTLRKGRRNVSIVHAKIGYFCFLNCIEIVILVEEYLTAVYWYVHEIAPLNVLVFK